MKYEVFSKKNHVLLFEYFGKLVARVKRAVTDEINTYKSRLTEIESLKRIMKEQENLIFTLEKEAKSYSEDKDKIARRLHESE